MSLLSFLTNCQSRPHCQYCPYRDRAYGLKIFSVL
eukprot:10291.XXX_637281_637382_1 [CDS] Oithona nana genome sequencing.